MKKNQDKEKIAAEEGGWQKLIITKQQMGEKLIPHPAAAPMGTDQEAGGAITTPDGKRKYD